MSTLVALAGLPGTGKSTIARHFARDSGAVWLRIDEIDAAIWARDPGRDIGPDSYHIAAALAASNLSVGHCVIVDSVNPWPLTRAIFAAAADRVGARLLGVEILCSDAALHRRRVEGRAPDVPGLVLPDWTRVQARDYAPWTDAALHLDTALCTPSDASAAIGAAMAAPPCGGLGVTG
ncbi:kinase [Meridianimarinicoccus roseus]|uniref:Kinase n=1 Tax=Meridianimarinicoccus roseus TaxID=2072018 RepID=A0A2V2LB92_9RHOB|nr:AAA family ATPase [Meridianimarinicoccus roseus]PWR02668.1 kinase [Meridianimarinicoccus roseus]